MMLTFTRIFVLANILVLLLGFQIPETEIGYSNLAPKQMQAGLPIVDDSSPKKMIIQFKDGTSYAGIQQYFHDRQMTPIKYLHQIDVWIVTTRESNPNALVSETSNAPEVLWSELDGVVVASEVIPNDDYYDSKQANLRLIGLPLAWNFTKGEQETIAIIDSGVDLDHPELMDKLWLNDGEIAGNGFDDDSNGYIDDIYGWNFIDDNAIPQDDYSHGSHVAGIAAAKTNNIIGIAGVSWGANIMALKSLDNIGSGSAGVAAEAIIYAADMGARILNLSWGNEIEFEVITLAIQYAQQKDCLVIAAAGNNASEVEYPAANLGVLAIASSDINDLPSSFSNRGDQVDLAAPGEDIFSANDIGSYYTTSGTSMSTPHVSGLAALIWSLRPGWDSPTVSQVITSTTKDVWMPGFDVLTGWGRIDAYAAIESATYHAYLPSVFSTVTDPPALR